MKKFWVSQNDQQLGPWTVAEIQDRFKRSELSMTDYVFDDQIKEWVLLLQLPEMATLAQNEFLAKNHSSQNEKVASVPAYNETEWFVLREENQFGPYTYFDLVKLLQNHKVSEYDYVWNCNMDSWKKVSELIEFSEDRLKQLAKDPKNELSEVFFRRRFARKPLGASLIVHNQKSVWKGLVLEISQGGAGLVLDEKDLAPNAPLFLHFKPHDHIPPFNAVCTVVSKRLNAEKKYIYGVKFTHVSQLVQKAIKQYAEAKEAA